MYQGSPVWFFEHWCAASSIIPLLPKATFTPSIQPNLGLPHCHPPLNSAINILLTIWYSSILSTCPNHLDTLWSALLANSLSIPALLCTSSFPTLSICDVHAAHHVLHMLYMHAQYVQWIYTRHYNTIQKYWCTCCTSLFFLLYMLYITIFVAVFIFFNSISLVILCIHTISFTVSFTKSDNYLSAVAAKLSPSPKCYVVCFPTSCIVWIFVNKSLALKYCMFDLCVVCIFNFIEVWKDIMSCL